MDKFEIFIVGAFGFILGLFVISLAVAVDQASEEKAHTAALRGACAGLTISQAPVECLELFVE